MAFHEKLLLTCKVKLYFIFGLMIKKSNVYQSISSMLMNCNQEFIINKVGISSVGYSLKKVSWFSEALTYF